ncbi:MAG: hypothetical protein Q9165_004745 [Trypethelium subeluteriae]
MLILFSILIIPKNGPILIGQGAPEVEDGIAGSFKRPESVQITNGGREYGPTAGIKPLREAVANLYNEHHRQGKSSKVTNPTALPRVE